MGLNIAVGGTGGNACFRPVGAKALPKSHSGSRLSVAAQVRLIPAKTMPARLAGITSESELVFAPVGMVVPPGPGLQGARPAPSGSTGSGPGSKLQNRIRFCRVKPGGSLWLIAKSLLSEVATDFQVAGKAETLWRLNQDRIGTGSPDLLPVGVRLALR